MKESGVWVFLRNGMVGKWHATRIESSSGNGVPDISFGMPSGRSGWIELKYVPEWPKKETTLQKLPLRPEQKHWIQVRGKMCGNVWVFVRIDYTFFILPWKEALEANKGWSKQRWLEAKNWSVGKLKFEELEEVLDYGC